MNLLHPDILLCAAEDQIREWQQQAAEARLAREAQVMRRPQPHRFRWLSGLRHLVRRRAWSQRLWDGFSTGAGALSRVSAGKR